MKKNTLTLSAAALGLAFGGLFSTLLLFLQWTSVIPWALTALLIGQQAPDQKSGAVAAAVFGIVLSYSFLAIGYRGATDAWSLLKIFAVFFVLLGLFGGACGAVLGFTGASLKRKA
jgi:hypothetical protein